jgi:hypothetical protein
MYTRRSLVLALLAAEGKTGARSVRMLTRLEVVQVRK